MQEELKILAHLVEQKLREESDRIDEKGECVGEIPSEMLDKLYKLRKIKDRLNEDTELRKRQLQLEAQRKMEEEFDERQEAYVKLHKEVWGEMYKTMLIDPRGYYFQEDGKLYTVRDKQKQNTPTFKMVDFTKPSRR